MNLQNYFSLNGNSYYHSALVALAAADVVADSAQSAGDVMASLLI